MVRVADSMAGELVGTTPATVAEMRGRPMKGWLRLDSAHVRTKRALKPWIRRALTRAESPSSRSSEISVRSPEVRVSTRVAFATSGALQTSDKE